MEHRINALKKEKELFTKILLKMKQDNIMQKELREKLNISEATMHRYLRQLTTMPLVVFIEILQELEMSIEIDNNK